MKKMTKKRIDKRMIVPFCVCVLLLAALACAVIWSQFADVDMIAEKYALGMLQNDADAVYSLYVPEAVSYVMRETDLTERDMKVNLRYKMNNWLENELTDEIGVLTNAAAELISKEDVPDGTVKELEANFGVNAQNAKLLTVAYHAEGEKGSKDGEMTVCAVKIGGKWYLYDLQMLLA